MEGQFQMISPNFCWALFCHKKQAAGDWTVLVVVRCFFYDCSCCFRTHFSLTFSSRWWWFRRWMNIEQTLTFLCCSVVPPVCRQALPQSDDRHVNGNGEGKALRHGEAEWRTSCFACQIYRSCQPETAAACELLDAGGMTKTDPLLQHKSHRGGCYPSELSCGSPWSHEAERNAL